MDAPCQGAYPDPVPEGAMKEAPSGGVCGIYVGLKCPPNECCTQFGFCAPEKLAPAPPNANRTNYDNGGINFWCGIASCIKPASPGSPACLAAHKLIKPAVRKFKLTYEWGEANPDGFGMKKVILVNGLYPGPTLEGEEKEEGDERVRAAAFAGGVGAEREKKWGLCQNESNTLPFPPLLSPPAVNLGDQVVVEFINNLDDVSVIHFHGMLQLGTPAFDGVQWVTQSPTPGAYTPTLTQPDSDPNAPPKYTYSFVAAVPGTFWYHR